MLVCLLFDWRYRYEFHGSLLLGSHWVTSVLVEGETTVTTRTRNMGLTQLPHVAFVSFRRSFSWWVFVCGWETLCIAQQRNRILVGQKKSSPYLYRSYHQILILFLVLCFVITNFKNWFIIDSNRCVHKFRQNIFK